MALTEQYETTWNEKFLKVKSVTGTGAGAIAETLAPGAAFQICEIRITSDGAVTTSENFTMTLDSGAGATFDQVIYSKDISVTGYPIQSLFDARRTYGPKDEIDIAFPNTETNTITFEIIYRVRY